MEGRVWGAKARRAVLSRGTYGGPAQGAACGWLVARASVGVHKKTDLQGLFFISNHAASVANVAVLYVQRFTGAGAVTAGVVVLGVAPAGALGDLVANGVSVVRTVRLPCGGWGKSLSAASNKMFQITLSSIQTSS